MYLGLMSSGQRCLDKTLSPLWVGGGVESFLRLLWKYLSCFNIFYVHITSFKMLIYDILFSLWSFLVNLKALAANFHDGEKTHNLLEEAHGFKRRSAQEQSS